MDWLSATWGQGQAYTRISRISFGPSAPLPIYPFARLPSASAAVTWLLLPLAVLTVWIIPILKLQSPQPELALLRT